MKFDQQQYIRDEVTGENVVVFAIVDGVTKSIPMHPGNSEYLELMRQVAEEGLVIAQADPVVTPASTETALNKVQFFTFLEVAFSMTPDEIVAAAQGAISDPVEKIVAKNKILHSESYHRENPLFDVLAPVLEITDEQIDAAWAQAVQVQ